ncbi:MAG: hypothetical protein JSR99_14515 [Proteobacteria bacterium]|nr:hypothetical protein [Pseudomonadota bacterium]
MRISVNTSSNPIDLEYDAEQTLWRSGEPDRGTALLHMLSVEFKNAMRSLHRHVILRNALRRSQNLSQILLFVGFGGGCSEILPVDDIFIEIMKEGAAGDGDLHIVCRWNVGRDGKPVFPHHPGRMMEVRRTIKLEELRKQSSNFVAWVDDCAAEADMQGGTWLKRRADDLAPRGGLGPQRLASL